MPEPFLSPAVEFCARLPVELNVRLRALAKAQHVSKNSVLVAAVADYLREADAGEEGI